MTGGGAARLARRTEPALLAAKEKADSSLRKPFRSAELALRSE
jgi:hypothetical protein